MECEFCKNILKTKNSLSYHIKNNKKCLEIQINLMKKVDSSLILCEFCSKSFSVTNINKHILNCKIKKKNEDVLIRNSLEKLKNINTDLEKYNKELINENNELKKYNDKLNNEIEKYIKTTSKENKIIQELKEYVIKLETENNIYKKDHETISVIAKQPKNTTNNIINNLSIYDDNEIKNRFCVAISNIKPSDLYDGQKSIGRFVAPCLKNEDGTKMISCSDYSRNIFIYKDKNGIINKDIKCKNLADLIEPIASAKADELIKEDYNMKEKISKLSLLHDQVNIRYNEIKELRNHLLGFEKYTKKWKHISDSIKKKVDENEIDIREIEILKNQGINTDDEDDEKLIVAVDDIKEMKKDSTKFSKVLSELV
jgi:hypothetical protein